MAQPCRGGGDQLIKKEEQKRRVQAFLRAVPIHTSPHGKSHIQSDAALQGSGREGVDGPGGDRTEPEFVVDKASQINAWVKNR